MAHVTFRRSFPMRRTLITLCASAIALISLAQDTAYVAPSSEEKASTPFKDRLWFGGGLGLNFGTVTAVQIDPLVGVYVDNNKRLSFGVGPSYYYVKYNSPIVNSSYTGYGYRLFSRYNVIEQAFVHAEFYHLNVERYNLVDQLVRTWVPHLLVGGGYREPIGGSSSLYLQILWEVLQDPNSVYRGQGPIITGGVGIGF